MGRRHPVIGALSPKYRPTPPFPANPIIIRSTEKEEIVLLIFADNRQAQIACQVLYNTSHHSTLPSSIIILLHQSPHAT